MDKDIEILRRRLTDGGYTCVIHSDGDEFISFERGVKPLMSFLDSGRSFRGAVAADKTVGAGAAHLYVLLGIKALWANVISDAALLVLITAGITVEYGERVPYITNRKGDGMCPIESAVAGIDSSDAAYKRIIDTLAQLNQKQKKNTEPH